MNKGSIILAFALGAAAGSVVTWRVLKTKYEQLVQEEIASVKEELGRKGKYEGEQQSSEQTDNESSDDTDDSTEEDKRAYQQITKNYGSISMNAAGKEKRMDTREPYVIPPDEFGDQDDHELITLTYYADGVLTDEDDQPIEDIDGTIGDEALTRFGEYEPDSIYVRDDEKKIDYEILVDTSRYSDRED